jgi:hypothetical protein
LGCCQWRQNQIVNLEPGLQNTFGKIFYKRHRSLDDLAIDFEPNSGHADGILDPRLAIDCKSFGDDMENFTVWLELKWLERHRLHADDIGLGDLAIGTANSHHAVAFLGSNLRSPNRDNRMVYGQASHALGFFQSFRNSRDSFIDVDNYPAANAL